MINTRAPDGANKKLRVWNFCCGRRATTETRGVLRGPRGPKNLGPDKKTVTLCNGPHILCQVHTNLHSTFFWRILPVFLLFTIRRITKMRLPSKEDYHYRSDHHCANHNPDRQEASDRLIRRGRCGEPGERPGGARVLPGPGEAGDYYAVDNIYLL